MRLLLNIASMLPCCSSCLNTVDSDLRVGWIRVEAIVVLAQIQVAHQRPFAPTVASLMLQIRTREDAQERVDRPSVMPHRTRNHARDQAKEKEKTISGRLELPTFPSSTEDK